MATLDKRNDTYGLDCKISPSMLARHEILTQESLASATNSTGISVQELVNLVCDLLDGEQDHDIPNIVGEESAPRVIEIRRQLRELWTYPDGRLVIG